MDDILHARRILVQVCDANNNFLSKPDEPLNKHRRNFGVFFWTIPLISLISINDCGLIKQQNN